MSEINPNLHGPEDMPLREYVRSFPMTISVYNVKTDELIRSENIDYSNFDHRRWLGKITHWACTNGYSVETMATKDHE